MMHTCKISQIHEDLEPDEYEKKCIMCGFCQTEAPFEKLIKERSE
jgi:translation initiation factor RLI1